MIEFFTEAFEPTFMQRALLASLVAVVATSIVGTWVVLRGLSFFGDALAHGVIPGIALAVLWGFSPVVGAFISALLMSGLVTAVSARTTVREDTAIGLLFVGMLALGVVIVSRARSFTIEVTALLFGDVLGVTSADIRTQVIAAAGNPSLRLFDLRTGTATSYDGHTNNVTAVGFQRDGKWLFTGSEDGTIKIWDVRAPGCQRANVIREFHSWWPAQPRTDAEMLLDSRSGQ